MKHFGKVFTGALVAASVAISAPALAATKVTLLFTASAPFMASFVAKDQGIFDKYGLDVDLQMAQNGSVIISALVAGSAQVGLPSSPVFIQALDNGLDLVAVAATNVLPDASAAGLVVAKDSGIAKPQDLIGKKIGVPGFGGILDITLRKWLIDSGVDVKKVNFVEIQLPQGADVLKSKQVDGIATVDPFFSRAVETAGGVSVGDYLKSLPENTVAAMYAATGDWVRANPEAAKNFQKAIAEGAAFALSHEKEAKESLAKYTKLPPPVVASIIMPKLNASITAAQLQFWVDLGNKQGFVNGKPDVSKAVLK